MTNDTSDLGGHFDAECHSVPPRATYSFELPVERLNQQPQRLSVGLPVVEMAKPKFLQIVTGG